MLFSPAFGRTCADSSETTSPESNTHSSKEGDSLMRILYECWVTFRRSELSFQPMTGSRSTPEGESM